MVPIAIATALAFQQSSQSDVAPYLKALEELTHELETQGFPTFEGLELHRVVPRDNEFIFEDEYRFAWIDPTGRTKTKYSLSGMPFNPVRLGDRVELESFYEQGVTSLFYNGYMNGPMAFRVMLQTVSSGRLDLVERALVATQIHRRPIPTFVDEVLLTVVVPRFNAAVSEYKEGRYSEARRLLLDPMTWLAVRGLPADPWESFGGPTTVEVASRRVLALAAETRRRTRDDGAAFDLRRAESLTGVALTDYVVQHLDEASALVVVPGGAYFRHWAGSRLLIEQGASAIPALQRVVETDTRLTKVPYRRYDGDMWYVYPVSRVAMQIIQEIETNDP
jgi:hypothetical protein